MAKFEEAVRKSKAGGYLVELYDVLDGFAVTVHLIEQHGTRVTAELRIHPVANPPGTRTKAAEHFMDVRHKHFGTWAHQEDTVPQGGLKATKVRPALNMGELTSQAREAVLRRFEPDRFTGEPRYMGQTAFTDRTPFEARDSIDTALLESPKWSKRDDRFFAVIASDYLRAVKDPFRDKGVYEAMADHIALSRHTLKDCVKEARRRGILGPPPSRGVPGGELTKKAKQVLKEKDK